MGVAKTIEEAFWEAAGAAVADATGAAGASGGRQHIELAYEA